MVQRIPIEGDKLDEGKKEDGKKTEACDRKGRNILGNTLIGVIDALIVVDMVVGPVFKIFLQEMGGQPQPPIDPQFFSDKGIKNAHRGGDDKGAQIKQQGFVEFRQVLFRQGGHEIPAHKIQDYVQGSKTEKRYQQQGKNAPRLPFFLGKPVHPCDFPESFPQMPIKDIGVQ